MSDNRELAERLHATIEEFIRVHDNHLFNIELLTLNEAKAIIWRVTPNE